MSFVAATANICDPIYSSPLWYSCDGVGDYACPELSELDSGWAQCPRTGHSIEGGLYGASTRWRVTVNSSTPSHWAATKQIRMRSGTKNGTRAHCAQRNNMMGYNGDVRVATDSKAATGTTQRLELAGIVRQLEAKTCCDVWVTKVICESTCDRVVADFLDPERHHKLTGWMPPGCQNQGDPHRGSFFGGFTPAGAEGFGA